MLDVSEIYSAQQSNPADAHTRLLTFSPKSALKRLASCRLNFENQASSASSPSKSFNFLAEGSEQILTRARKRLSSRSFF